MTDANKKETHFNHDANFVTHEKKNPNIINKPLLKQEFCIPISVIFK